MSLYIDLESRFQISTLILPEYPPPPRLSHPFWTQRIFSPLKEGSSPETRMTENVEDNLLLPELQNHLNLENSSDVWCLRGFVVVHSLAYVQSLHNRGA